MAVGSITAHVRLAIAVAVGIALSGDAARAGEPLELASPAAQSFEGPVSSAYPNGTFSEQLASASQGGDGPVGGAKYRPGPGRRDDWKVGPKWRGTFDGVLLFRDNANLDAILAEVAPIAPSTVLPPLEFRDNFDHAAGVRMMLTSEFPQCSGYELQIGYLGVEKWLANAYYERETLTAASLPLSDVDVQQQRTVGYESSLHALEINFQRETRGYLKPFAGMRYFRLDEAVFDQNQQFTTGVLPDPTVVGDTISSATTQTLNAVEVQNDLIGFQGGLRLDMWQPTQRLHLNGFLSAGVFCNIVDRDRVFEDSSTVTTNELVSTGTPAVESVETTSTTSSVRSVVSADGTRIAFATEAALAATWRLSNSTALRGGYQVLYLHGVELAENMWVAPPPVTAIEDELFLHGWFAGLEYRR